MEKVWFATCDNCEEKFTVLPKKNGRLLQFYCKKCARKFFPSYKLEKNETIQFVYHFGMISQIEKVQSND